MNKSGILGLVGALSFSAVSAQTTTKGGQEFDLQLNTITTAVPFMLIAPDSRSGAMGDVGVALSPDANAMHWNASKLAFAQEKTNNEFEVSVGYSPWLSNLVPDINLAYLSGYKQLDQYQSIGASLRYFSLGNITFTDISGNVLRDFKPSEFAVELAYARKLSEYFSVGVTGKYIYSNLTGGTQAAGQSTKPGQAGAADISAFYTNEDINVGGMPAIINAGVNVSNIGNKMSYTNATSDRDFIPTNLRLGSALTMDFDEYNRFTVSVDANKLLVPTPPIYAQDSLGRPIYDPVTQTYEIEAGKNPEVGVATGIFQSFTDAPGFPLPDENGDIQYDQDGNVIIDKGSRFREELREVNLSIGAEYWYSKQFAVRAGFFYEHPTKGNRQFFTLGAGLKYSVFALDLSYLIPTQQRHPLANTLRFTLRFNFESFGGGGDDAEG